MSGHIGAGNRAAIVPPDMAQQCRWVTTEFAMGDVLLFPSTTVHASLHNASEFYMRISVDFRYQLEGETLTEGCLEPHFRRLSWEEVYEGWTSAEHQYYWRDLDYRVEPFRFVPPVDHDPDAGFSPQDLRDILTYEERVKERTRRRMEILGRELVEKDTRVTTFDPDRQVAT
jgi:hypothetical protein